MPHFQTKGTTILALLKRGAAPSFETHSCHVLVLKVVYDIDSVTHTSPSGSLLPGLALHSYILMHEDKPFKAAHTVQEALSLVYMRHLRTRQKSRH